jgi:hypothetical protein
MSQYAMRENLMTADNQQETSKGTPQRLARKAPRRHKPQYENGYSAVLIT